MHLIVILGALISISFTTTYLIASLRGRVKPNRITWLIWGIAPLISTAASLSTGVSWASLPVFMAGFGPILVFIVSSFNKAAYWRIERFDYICGLVSILSLVAWYLTKSPNVAISLAILSDALAALPTMLKGWKYPETENSFLFLGSLFSASTSFTEIHHWNFAEVAFPIYLILLSLTMLFLIEGRRKYLNYKKVL
ncbi:hypothetical protein LLCRE1631_02013 [Lactococcus lactis subsp. lactis CNCM I-1631]|uniref:hypothetical protein n=1 Tax=Lactococcus lactis TaxID=1358 RepID=UPI000230EB42|nr:hypothetical protein [Lactococcus lactis]EHE92555.1 hypothetical protein LLCRE1631_02013 [Lactococcus lactis subsp. lactis CNCM I-1631]